MFGTPGYNDETTDDVILKAIDDAVADGMDVINLSLGIDLAPRLEDDLEVEAIENAHRAGVLVVAAAGNNGPGFGTVSSPATAPSAITVGASRSDRTFVASAGLPLPRAALEVSAVSGGGTVVSVVSRDEEAPGLYAVRVRLGPTAGPNVFRIQAGSATADVTISGQ